MDINILILIGISVVLAIIISVYISSTLNAPDTTIDFSKNITGLDVITRISPLLQQNMNKLISNIQNYKPEDLKTNLKTILNNALNSVKILDPKNVSKQGDAIQLKIKQVDDINDSDSLQKLANESLTLIEDVPNTTDNILQNQIDKLSSLTSQNIDEIRKTVIPEVSKTLTDLINNLKLSIDTRFYDLGSKLEEQVKLLNSFQTQYKLDYDALKVLVATSIKTAKDDLSIQINDIIAINQRQDKDISDINLKMTSRDSQITNILTRSIPDINKLISDLQNKQITDVSTLNSRLDSLSKSITDFSNKQATDVSSINQNITEVQTLITNLRNDNTKSFADMNILINRNVSNLTDIVKQLSDLASSDINSLYTAFNNMKNTLETQKIVINTPQNTKWTITGDSDGRLCVGNPNPVTCIDNTGNLVLPASTTSELNNVVNVPALPTVNYSSILPTSV